MKADDFLRLCEHPDEHSGSAFLDAVQRLDDASVQRVLAVHSQAGTHPLSCLIGGALGASVAGEDTEGWIHAVEAALERGFPLQLSTSHGFRDAGHEVLDVLESLSASLADDLEGEALDPVAAREAGRLLDVFLARGWSPYEDVPMTLSQNEPRSVSQRIQAEGNPELETWLAEHEAALIDQGLPLSHEGLPPPRL